MTNAQSNLLDALADVVSPGKSGGENKKEGQKMEVLESNGDIQEKKKGGDNNVMGDGDGKMSEGHG